MRRIEIMTYIDFVTEQIKHIEPGTPIYIADLAVLLAEKFDLKINKANAATSVAMKRILDRKYFPYLRFYKKGIYYFTIDTPFGEVGIDKEQLIQRKYLSHDTGYETEYTALYRLGLTTQVPAERVIVTNKTKEGLRMDKNLGVYTRCPKTEITKDNKNYLQVLDVLGLIDKAPIDAEEPYILLSNYLVSRNLRYDKLLALANRYYPQNAAIEIARIANAGEA